MEFTYMKTPLYRYTFKNRRIREWVEMHSEGCVLNLFAGKYRLNVKEVRNDLNPDMVADYNMDALEFIKYWLSVVNADEREKFGTILLDPPYALRKSMEMYHGVKSSPFNQIKNHIEGILKPNGLVITFGYHSNVMGVKRGYIQEHILLMSHGGAIHDTIAVIERRDSGITREELKIFF